MMGQEAPLPENNWGLFYPNIIRVNNIHSNFLTGELGIPLNGSRYSTQYGAIKMVNPGEIWLPSQLCRGIVV